MKDDIDLSQLKERYNLWWEYLRRSQDYRTVCECIRHEQSQPGDNWTKELEVWSPEDFNDKLTTIMKCVWEYVKSPYLDDNKQLMVLLYYPRIQNIFHQTFDDFWKRQELWLLLEKDNLQTPIKAAKDTIAIDLRLCKESYEKKYGREPSANELIGYFQYAFCETDLYKYLKIEYISNNTIKDIKDDFYNQIKDGLNHKYNKFVSSELGKRHLTFTGNVYVDALTRYLQVFDLKESGLKWNEILNKIPEYSKDSRKDDLFKLREAQRDYEAALKTINQVENGYFP